MNIILIIILTAFTLLVVSTFTSTWHDPHC